MLVGMLAAFGCCQDKRGRVDDRLPVQSWSEAWDRWHYVVAAAQRLEAAKLLRGCIGQVVLRDFPVESVARLLPSPPLGKFFHQKKSSKIRPLEHGGK